MNDVSMAVPAAENQSSSAMTPAKGLLMLLGVIIVVAGFIGLNAVLGIHEFWGGFLFLLYWAGLEHTSFNKLPACIVGALVGLGMGYLLSALPVWLGQTEGGLAFLGLVLVLVYFQIMGWLPVAVNMVAMLFLTVTTVPSVQQGTDFAAVLAGLVLGIVYFVALVWLAGRFRKQA